MEQQQKGISFTTFIDNLILKEQFLNDLIVRNSYKELILLIINHYLHKKSIDI